MGKTEKGTLWVSREKTSAFEFFQHFVNCLDTDVERLLRFFTKININEIKRMCMEDIVNAKKLMAFEVTKLVHGEEEAINAREISKSLFDNGETNQNMQAESVDCVGKINILDFLAKLSIIKSKSEARRLIEQGGIVINNIKKTDISEIINLNKNEEIIVRKGKKTFVKVKI
jgi:tyrosyl-tRNA synthetase